jgi:hypothetical protein
LKLLLLMTGDTPHGILGPSCGYIYIPGPSIATYILGTKKNQVRTQISSTFWKKRLFVKKEDETGLWAMVQRCLATLSWCKWILGTD